jgi:hypothetical protein
MEFILMVPYVKIQNHEYPQVDNAQDLIVYDATKYPRSHVRLMWRKKWIHTAPNLEAYLTAEKDRIETMKKMRG